MSFALAKKLSPANQLGWPLQKNISIHPAHNLRAARRMDFHWRLRASCGNGCYGRSAGTSARRLCFSHAALIKPDFNVMLSSNADKLHIHAFFKVRLPANLRPFTLPVRRKLFRKDYKMRIAHGDRGPKGLAVGSFYRECILHLGLAHLHFKVEAVLIA